MFLLWGLMVLVCSVCFSLIFYSLYSVLKLFTGVVDGH